MQNLVKTVADCDKNNALSLYIFCAISKKTLSELLSKDIIFNDFRKQIKGIRKLTFFDSWEITSV
ncbi:MAG TPA: hypothetical protein VF648_05860 [Pyrinomonadaceae bacterium]